MNILFLHGFTQSGPLFSAKTKAVQKALTKALGADTTFNFPTAPLKLQPADIPGNLEQPTEAETETEAYGWWRRAEPSGEYMGLAEMFAFLSEYLDAHGPFDGVVGFSQGAALAAILAAVLENDRPRPETFTTSHPPLKFAACYCGFRAPERYEEWYTPKVKTPTLHVIGTLDTVVDEARSLALVKACEKGDENTVYHPGGHYLPSQKNVVGALVGFIRICTEEKKEETPVEDMDVPF
ncbi:serine hydrolase FSH [Sphaerosporella brunnea]|uniref:Serine hydrolase FSH n=1 Tax=Sphaerosporella brunnea TaxID=1250544 RepID=A0A5J5FAE3_9PEZI|nr:serine hydrolase FSH [Sphaerosporella brunnea]